MEALKLEHALLRACASVTEAVARRDEAAAEVQGFMTTVVALARQVVVDGSIDDDACIARAFRLSQARLAEAAGVELPADEAAEAPELVLEEVPHGD